MEILLKTQTDLMKYINNFASNTNKTGKDNCSESYLQTRITLLEQYWNKFQANHEKLLEKATASDLDNNYFQSDPYEKIESIYCENMGLLKEMLRTFYPVTVQTSHNSTTAACTITSSLPKINLNRFGGELTEWTAFYDLFKSLIDSRNDLTGSLKLYYLKTTLYGQAEQLLRNIAVTDANYESALKILSDRYQNNRILVYSHLQKLTSLPAMKFESAEELKRLFDGTTEAVKALECLNRPVTQWDDWLIFITTHKLDTNTRKDWEDSISSSTDLSTFHALCQFLQNRINTLEAISPRSHHYKPKDTYKGTSTSSQNFKTPGVNVKAHHSSTPRRCPDCSGTHLLLFCPSFRQKTVAQRRDFVMREQLCFNCLRTQHTASNCPSKNRCKHCQQMHHSMLHLNHGTSIDTTATATNHTLSTIPESQNTLNAFSISTFNTVLLATAKVVLKSSEGRSLVVRALLDQGSQATFISSTAAAYLRLSKTRVNIPISGIGSCEAAVARSLVHLKIQSRILPEFQLESKALVLPKLTKMAIPQKFTHSDYSHLIGLQLADPDFSDNSTIDLILGADNYHAILQEGIRKGRPTAQNSTLGWVLSGPLPSSSYNEPILVTTHTISINTEFLELDRVIRKFWEIEELPLPSPLLSDEDKACEEYYRQTTTRDSSGRYIVRLPIKQGCVRPLKFGDSRASSVNCLLAMERRFLREPALKSRYVEFMQEYHRLQHMRHTSSPQSELEANTQFYLPHHGILREDNMSTKLRVVFNGSRKSRGGCSLNECLATGPALQRDLRSIILRWRKHSIVFTADIRMMFRQIRTHDEDNNLQSIVCRNNPSEPVQDFQLCTVTYGTTPAPFLAIRTLLQLAEDERSNFPLGSKVLSTDCYVDDILTGADDVKTSLEVQRQLIGILNSGGFQLHKWSSNDPMLLEAVQNQSPALISLAEDSSVKTLGLLWYHNSDSFGFQVTLSDPPPIITKRNILSDVAKLYDPLGLLSPTTLLAKSQFQSLWLEKHLEWDTPVSNKIAEEWLTLRQNLHHLEEIVLPRWIGCHSKSQSYELHVFSDTSEKAYAAVAYLRVCHDFDNVQISLICSKTKLSPIKKLSIPRLELSGAHLMARLISSFQSSMGFANIPVYCWTDSQIVLTWLKSHPSRWKTFVANRCSHIHELVPTAHWRHVPGSHNPADCASRGVQPNALPRHDIWWQGPAWLKLPSTIWPNANLTPLEKTTDLEERMSVSTSIISSNEHPTWELIGKYSSLHRLLRITALCMRFRDNIRCEPLKRSFTHLSASEIETARLFWIRQCQQESFPKEYNSLSKGKKIKTTSSLLLLAPFFDVPTKTLRVGGRLQNSELPADSKHQFILAKNSRLTDLIIHEAHQTTLHGGVSLMLNYIRQRFWILSCRDKIRRYVRRCVICFRQRESSQSQLMGILPADRVRPARPFLHTGLDYAGPVQVRHGPGRGKRSHKAYIAIFVCMVVKAVHIELVSDQSTPAFIAAYKRFTARRGFCEKIYSDNAKNFVGAATEFQQASSLLKGQLPEELSSILASQRTTWYFIPPNAPNFGGLWEAGVKAIKHHLKRVIGDSTLTFEELYTLLTLIEACLNSRPLHPISSDTKDPEAITPGHFLIGCAPLSPLEPSLQSTNINLLTRWKMVQRMYEDFWRKWSADYLNNLQVRTKWKSPYPNLRLDSIVLIRDDRIPPSQWALGKIVAVHPGADGLVRVASIKCKDTILKRAVSKICPLPIPINEEEDPE